MDSSKTCCQAFYCGNPYILYLKRIRLRMMTILRKEGSFLCWWMHSIIISKFNQSLSNHLVDNWQYNKDIVPRFGSLSLFAHNLWIICCKKIDLHLKQLKKSSPKIGSKLSPPIWDNIIWKSMNTINIVKESFCCLFPSDSSIPWNKMSHLCQPIYDHKNWILSISKRKIYNKIHW